MNEKGEDMDPGTALVVGGVQALGSLVTGILNNRAAEKARKEQEEWNLINLKYSLAGQRAGIEQARKAQALAERQQKFTEREAAFAKGERAEERGYGRAMSAYQRAADVLNQNQVNLARRTAPLMGRAA